MTSIPQVGDTIRITDATCKSSVGKVCKVQKIDELGLAWVCVGHMDCGLLGAELVERLRPEQMELVERSFVELKPVKVRKARRRKR